MLPEPSDLPKDPVTPVPPPPPHKIAMLSAGGLATLLAALSMLGPFSIDAYLPAFPQIQAQLAATPLQVQQTLTAYMLAFAVMVLWHGALSDAFGRRNVILVALVVFAIGSFGCASASSVEYLWVFRVLQGVSAGAGVVVGRAIIRDLYSDTAAARLLSMVTMIFSIAPAIAPVVGGWIVTLLDWRAIFLALSVYTVLLFWFCWKHLPETVPPTERQPFNPRFLAQSYGAVFSSFLFLTMAGVTALNFAGLFLYIAAAPVMLPESLGLGPSEFAWLFVPTVSGIFFGSLVANRLAGKMDFARQIRMGFFFMLGAVTFNVIYHAFLPPALPWTVAPMFFFTFGSSLIAPGATLLALDLFPRIRGTVASCQSFILTLLGAVVAGAVAPALSHSVLALALGQAFFVLLSLLCWDTARRHRRKLRARGEATP
ncbi:multidrug effflux MFS transporter [Massilia aurea]|jgi:MFS transporter, DHA1 family, multidrug resistance protein|uniref:multidrug effflux MFS transporter n=1 Tax=Massilia aurea TaxID=373040 RepID=UPI002163BC42|nr:multidrug effflux MFS transporter [Massilia aurea]MCS0707473.1 multidrug effflux MFS transporter [Massilia aurea]